VALALGGELPARTSAAWAPAIQLSLSLRLDAATLALAALVSLIGSLVVGYAAAYFPAGAKARRAIGTLAIFEATMLGLVLADDLLLLFVFWELTGICSFFLIKTDADKRADAFAASRMALIVTGAGALPMLVGFIYLIAVTGTSRLSEIVLLELSPADQAVVLVLVLFGVVTKSAQVPFHFWLPGAMAAPSPISAYLHSATMVKAGVILLLYLYPVVSGTPLWTSILVPLGAATCLFGAYRALAQEDIKLLMAWSTVSQLGLLCLTAGLGTDLAARAVVLHLFAHAVFKAGLFLSVGAIDHAAHTRQLAELGGLGRRAPLLLAACAILAGSMMGLPPFAGFLSKELILEKAMLAHPVIHGLAISAIAVGSVGTVAYTLRFLLGTFAGEPRSEGARAAHAPGFGLMLGPAVLAALTLIGGLAAPITDRVFLEPASEALLRTVLEAPDLALWHGITPVLIWSIAIVSAGVVLYRRLRVHPLRKPPRDEGERAFDRFLDAAQRIGGAVAAGLSGLNPNAYFAAAVLLGYGAAALTLPAMGRLDLSLPLGGGIVLGLLVVLIVALLRLEGRLTRVLLLGLVGAVIALLFRLLHAPDLMLTQLLVEALLTVFLALSLRMLERCPGRAPMRGTATLGRVAIAAVAGLGAAALVAGLLTTPADSRLLDFYLRAGPEIAKGRNLVNVILVDFRGLDTLVETIVVVLAAFGVGGLLHRREMPSRAGSGRAREVAP
ncbi:MAG: DUF4040 domain-containing protein, partial [Deltaproteobacteria bacterium]|nr:DUF4040 domain-containing protein [Deltaproteobacteria bacterium]MBW2534957.1 DUF4040 domain-containing protein [Deltaproteobacteria bacterium]